MARITTYKSRNRSRNKYGNRKVECDGFTFDSVKEMNRYCDLKYMLLAGEISDLELQKEYELQEAFIDKHGKRHRPIYYIADFVYTDNKTGEKVIEDVKSKATANDAVYRIKKKMMLYRGLEIVEV